MEAHQVRSRMLPLSVSTVPTGVSGQNCEGTGSQDDVNLPIPGVTDSCEAQNEGDKPPSLLGTAHYVNSVSVLKLTVPEG